jgi:hypothetical protein
VENLPEMNLNDIAFKLQGDWADWDDKEDSYLHIRKSELMHALQKMESEIHACHFRIHEMIIKGEELKKTRWICGHEGMGPGDEYVGRDPCDTCLLDMKLKLLKLSRLLNDKDLRTAYTKPPYIR